MNQTIGRRSDSAKVRKIAAASMAGTALEYYDFSIYGLAAVLIFPQLFFPEGDSLIGVLASLGTLAVGYLSRPIGAIAFGHFGDKFGRKPVLVSRWSSWVSHRRRSGFCRHTPVSVSGLQHYW